MNGQTGKGQNYVPVLPEVRPLVIPVTPAGDETLIGLIARSTAANVLGRTSIILKEVGVDLHHPGTVGQKIGSLLDRLAEKIGCDVEMLRHRLHPYTPEALAKTKNKNANFQWPVQWGSGSLLRHHVLLDRRRIAPTTLATSNHHRWHWLCTLLPYCPFSLERLVDTCLACGTALRWRQARGIGRCEKCRVDIAPSSEPALDEHLAADYRAFARLISPTPGERETALTALHPDLNMISPTSLISFICRIGWILGSHSDLDWSFSPASLDQPALAEAVSVGTGTLGNWPDGLRSTVADRLRGTVGDERHVILNRIRKLGDRYAPTDMAKLVRDALPEAFKMTQRAMSFEMPTMLSCDICKLTGIDVDDVRRLEAAGIFTTIETRVGQRRHVQFSRAEVHEFARHKKGSQRATRMAEALGVPRYAIEQLLGHGEVVRETHPGLLIHDDNLRLVTSTVDALFKDLNGVARKGSPPEDAIPLWNASRATGGRMKNWGETLRLLRSGAIHFWLIPDDQRSQARHSKYVRRILVVPGKVIPVLSSEFDAALLKGVPTADVMSQVDAAELLNIDAVQMKRVAESGDLTFSGHGKALWAKKNDVLELALAYISSPEAAYLLGGPVRSFAKRLYARTDLRRGSVGWLREDIAREFDNLKVGDVPVFDKWRGPGGRFSLASRANSRSGQRNSLEV
ncbi:hypothetical protein [Sphingomonas albertensis]|uniref:TniQ protein n=1 Tax=Sphingomonas albertensis TaxID=2762591 RepID=A0ABR7AL42_9SPHN|nr:hypothetical protein [Sphingomonas albertensis]MBC3941185.1 hypothetical protein [Sphingomonas albertensis]